MDKKNNESYSKGTILIIILLFMFSSKIFNVVWDIGKSLIYIFIIKIIYNLIRSFRFINLYCFNRLINNLLITH